jgi:phytoene dehydrogenase-like protein
MRIAVVGAGVGGLAAGARLAQQGHAVTVYEQASQPGGKCGRVERDGFAWDSGPSLLTMPWVVRDLLGDSIDLLRVEPVTRYRFADGSELELSADLPRAMEALEAWSPGAGADWARFLGVCAGMWRASVPFLTGPPPWPPRLDAKADPRDLLRIKPWHTLRTLARVTVRDPRLRLVVERFATYAGADPRRAPAVLAVAGYVEHAFGAWHPRGGLYELVRALVRRLEAAGGELRLDHRVEDPRALGADLVVDDRPRGGDSLSGYALMLGLRGRTPRIAHHTITFPADYDAEFDDVFVNRRPVHEPTLYVSCPEATEGGDDESWFVLVNAPNPVSGPPGLGRGPRHRLTPAPHSWSEYGDRLIERLGVGDRVVARAQLTPLDYGPIYGRAPHGRLGTLKRPGQRGPGGSWRVGGTVHPGGGLPLVMLGAATVAREIGPA